MPTSDEILRSVHVLHPFFGFTMRPGVTPADVLTPSALQDYCRDPMDLSGAPPPTPSWATLPANALGMWSEEAFPYVGEPDDLIVGLVGGSVATWFALQGREALRERFAAIPELGGQRVVVLGFGIPGGKQPQQLAVLNYVLSRGQRLDLVVNVDGINEIMWARYNHARGIDFSFPTGHILNPLKHVVHGGDAGADGVLALARSLRWRLRAERVAAWRKRLPIAALDVLEQRLRQIASRGFSRATDAAVDPARDPMPLPPPQGYGDEPPAATYWRDCSLQMSRLCAAHRILYLHVLQPNLYSAARRPSESEQALLRPDDPNVRTLREEYPRLSALGQELRDAGVLFASGEAAFSKIPYPVFSDCWGHLNQLGNRVLADLIGGYVEMVVRQPAPAAASAGGM